jgi:hypothetical protein
MRHAEAIDLLELAALEPGGLDRITSGTDPASADVAAHLAGCDACRAELVALRRSVAAIGETVRSTPAADLRGRTLDYVARVGRPRAPDAQPTDSKVGGESGWLAWLPRFSGAAAVAAVVMLLIVGSAVSSRMDAADAAIAEQRAAIAGLTVVTDWSLRIASDPEASRIRLEAPDGGAQAGTVLFSDATGELAMVASGLPALPEGQEYRCWVEVDGTRVPIGTMYRAGELSYWVGEVDETIGVDAGRAFGVSLMASAADGVDGEVVLLGDT